MAEAKFKSGWQTLPPPPGLRRHVDDSDSDTQNVVLRALQTPTVTDTQVEVANPQNTDPLDTDRDANRDKALQVLRYRSRCQDDIFPRIELIPSFVLSSDNTNCKNDIQLFHQLFDELSVYRDYH